MIEGDFIQFYTVRKVPNSYSFYDLYNGYSYIADLVNIRWIDMRLEEEFIPKHEKIYVCVWYGHHFGIAMNWARKYPKNQFYIGGPLFQTSEIRCGNKHFILPKNMHIITGTLEHHFNLPINLKNWKLDFPYKDLVWQYSYYIGIYCYWNGCTFCHGPRSHGNHDAVRAKLGYDLEPLLTAPPGLVYLSCPAPTPKMLVDILPKLDYSNKKYFIYLRGSAKELEALKSIQDKINIKQTIFGIGVEFPSDRMLKIMNKGIKLQEYTNIIKFMKSINSRTNLFFIAGWPELIQQDLDEAKRFLDDIDIYGNKRFRHVWGNLNLEKIVDPIHKTENVSGMKFIVGYQPVMTETQKRLNDRFKDMLGELGALNRTYKNQISLVNKKGA